MLSKKILLKRSKLYLILDTQVNSYNELFNIARSAIKSGVKILQIRDKYAEAGPLIVFVRRLLKIARGKALIIVNDRVDIALLTQADGVHLGQQDIALGDARRVMGKKFLIGISCQNLEAARKAQAQGADYIGFGSVFKTKTKPERNPMNLKKLKRVCQKIRIPVFAIGGINGQNVKRIRALGVKRVAVCRAICEAKNKRMVFKKFNEVLS